MRRRRWQTPARPPWSSADPADRQAVRGCRRRGGGREALCLYTMNSGEAKRDGEADKQESAALRHTERAPGAGGPEMNRSVDRRPRTRNISPLATCSTSQLQRNPYNHIVWRLSGASLEGAHDTPMGTHALAVCLFSSWAQLAKIRIGRRQPRSSRRSAGAERGG